MPIAITTVIAVIGVLLTGELSGSWAGSIGAVSLFFRRTWFIMRRRVAFAVRPSGVYLGPTLSKPKQRPE
ncbi:hypothetical protein [Actinomadura madurae]|uniref:hypothetical protein n=1 Tax=Actinomadura madurae TaxID=1993 RepID=UPI000943844D|nr:hypothetical protein [Actinomadura madurae]